ncbi:probable atp-dependent rna helicase dhx35 isoform 1 [Stylonychia lemnae]|uniref:RNA helicase n=1 Tax=Stylonychia lemnae TaxID=5949 RepID=A0A078A5L1_STYLE|nr:probable atp-dependent rna helicase dhx35 isoform 1 [Stylonychia lemnae]|eukprot:CDW77464.1 probable atp-dependent rna helicase dhx35 isoform 1 [Stylonychia lemnae]
MKLSKKQLNSISYKVLQIKDNQIVLIQGETGSGKTTQVPKILFEARKELHNKHTIAITQPRRVAAISLAMRVSQELNKQVGDVVGYRVRFEEKLSVRTRIKFLTDGMLLREAIIDSNLKQYGIVILDEAHERTVNSDTLMALLKKIASQRQDATLEVEKFCKYFGTEAVVEVKGRTFPIEIYNILGEEEDGDILSFLTGQEDIEEAEVILKEKFQIFGLQDQVVILPLYANLPSEQQMRVFKAYPQRKIILSTNIAETSVTISGVRYVIDSGLVKIRTYKNSTGIDALKVEPISQNSAIQRAGRAGRERAGKCFRLFTEESFKELEPNTIPEIMRCNLSGVILNLKAIGIKDVSKIDFIDKPTQQSYVSAFQILMKLGTLNPQNAELTQLGQEMAILPTEPLFSKLLITALKDEYIEIKDSISAIVGLLSVENILFQPKGQESIVLKKRKKFINTESDHLTLLNIFSHFKEVYKTKSKKDAIEFAREHFFNDKSLVKALLIKEQLDDYLKQIIDKRNKNQVSQMKQDGETEKMSDYQEIQISNKEKQQKVVRCLKDGLILNVATLEKGNQYKTMNNEECSIHPSSFLIGSDIKKGSKEPGKVLRQKIIFSEIINTTKNYLKYVTDITFID